MRKKENERGKIIHAIEEGRFYGKQGVNWLNAVSLTQDENRTIRERELQRVEEALRKAEREVNKKPVDLWATVGEAMKGIGLQEVDEDYLTKNFNVSYDEAKKALQLNRHWEWSEEDAFGGIDIYHSPLTKCYYDVWGEWSKNTGYSLKVKQVCDQRELMDLLGFWEGEWLY
ncbi:MAG: hypothetical protein ACP5KW_12320 [Thermoproteota archaeon]